MCHKEETDIYFLHHNIQILIMSQTHTLQPKSDLVVYKCILFAIQTEERRLQKCASLTIGSRFTNVLHTQVGLHYEEYWIIFCFLFLSDDTVQSLN